MIRKFQFVILAALMLIHGITSAQEKPGNFPVLKGLYFGQTAPGITPEIFAPEILSKTQPEWAFCSVFSPAGDEFWFTLFDRDKKVEKFMIMKRVDDTWSKPKPAVFNGEFSNNDLCISYDGNQIFFRSRRPLPDNSNIENRSYIWYTVRSKTGWSKPEPVECGDRYLQSGYPSISSNGTLYFSYDAEDKSGIFQSRLVNGAYSAPEHVCTVNDTLDSEGDMCVAPDESYMIVSCWNLPENNGESDLYISFRKSGGSWTEFKNIGIPVNRELNEGCPTISPDGKYLFYFSVDGSSNPAKCNTYWIDLMILEDLKPDYLK